MKNYMENIQGIARTNYKIGFALGFLTAAIICSIILITILFNL